MLIIRMRAELHRLILPTLLCLVALIANNEIQAELENWEDYPVILTTEHDKAIFLTPESGCHVVEDRRLMEKMMVRKNNVFQANSTTAREIIVLCKEFQDAKINATQFVIQLHEKSVLIYPGTHWCGMGNNAKDENELGYYRETDMCCREHDSCTESVSGWSCHPEIKELCNWAPFTRSHCNCDTKFRECLQRSSEPAAYTIGQLFFTVFGLKCYRRDYPATGCAEYGGFLNIHCQRYNYNYNAEPYHQFFDSPKYSPARRAIVGPSTNSSAISQQPVATADSPFNEKNVLGEGGDDNLTMFHPQFEMCLLSECW